MVSVSSSTVGGVYASQVNRSERDATKSLLQVSSGKAINKASDNAAGLAIASQLLSDVSTLKQVSTNLVQASSVLQTADGSLEQTGNILNRMKELSTQAGSGSLDVNSQKAVNDEYQNLKTELDKTSNSTSFNGQQLVNGTYNNDFQTGTSATDVLNVNLTGIDSSSTGLGFTAGGAGSATALSTPTEAKAASADLDNAIRKVSSYRAEVGALQSNVSTRSEVVDSNIESDLSAQSAIMDADIGKSMSEFTNSKLLNEVALASAAQGNKMNASMLKLVR
ncbi:MAG: hypothetical protein A3J37_02750 [Alphaproteobacteria bacterium RIFCSPHIGHO2_12_FULL_45_9]|nr:MAG: hypothetical protein A3B66_08015 [Alphaproteobacteria bacterium RIFCSPHIGHO2_02_FULL_46_13]OFW93857.1 MAG: hypothetical protein A3J37_02750 [Alphaproteobacteria bacterium RIFCSPHIGHO2_12_FULL_45_9]